MIYPSGRAAALTALAAIPALAVALLLPGYWYAGLVVLAFILALTLADALATAPVRALEASVDAPSAAFVGQDFAIGVSARIGERALPIEVAIEHDARLKPLPFRGGVGVGAVTQTPLSLLLTAPTPNPSPEGEGGTRRLPFTAIRRGSAALDALWLRWSGPFRLAWRQKRIPLTQRIAILPDIRGAREEALRLFRRDAPIGEMAMIDTGAGGEFQALAEFRAGMDRRAIDWKHSARHRKLLAKEYRTERNNDIVFAIDAGRLMCEPVEGIPRIDRAVSAALAAAFVALKLGDKVSLFGFDARPRISSGSVSGVASFATFQRLAAQLDYSTEETNYTFALATLGAQLKRRSLVLIFTDFVDPTSAELMLRTVGRLAERHLVLFVLMHDSELETLASAAPNTPEDVSRTVIAAAMLRERRIVITRLQRLGAHVVEASHRALGPALVNAYIDIKRRDLL